MKERKCNAISFFSGGGGLDLGAEAAGFVTRLCIDNDRASCQTLKQNRNVSRGGGKKFLSEANIYNQDITKLTPSDILKGADLNESEVDLIYGGPPCQAFSVFGRRKGMEDPRGPLLLEFVEAIHDIRPQVFVLENVPGLKTISAGQVYKDLVELLKKKTNGGKYNVQPFILNVRDFGVPQVRERIIIIGSRKKIEIPPPLPTHGSSAGLTVFKDKLIPYNTVEDAFRHLPKIGSLPNHTGREHSDDVRDRYDKLKFGERDSVTRINRLDPRKPSYTIIVGSEHGGGKGHVHPYEPRELTPRESARIQTFPDDWEFIGTRRETIRQVGNAVPPIFAAQLFRHIQKNIFKDSNAPAVEELFHILGQQHLRF